MKFDFDTIVIGAGSGGLTVSIGLAAAGKKVALIEGGRIGGDCTNFGCVPSKALIDIGKSGKYDNIKDALSEVRERRQKIRDEETKEELEKHKIKFIKGFASFEDKNTLKVGGKTYSAKNIVISTGSHPIYPDIKGLNKENTLTNENIFELNEDIKDLVILGGGYIGCELAESFANLGVKVTIIQRNKKLIPREEKESCDIIEKIFKQKNIEVLLETTIKEYRGDKLILESKGKELEKKLNFKKILIALGRQGNIGKLNLEKLGIKHSKKGIVVNKYNQTNIKNIFAIGDVVDGNPKFTHLANNEGRGIIRNILFPYIKSSTRKATLPSTLYTNIEVARVGKTEAELIQSDKKTDFISKIMYFDTNDRSKLTNDKLGFIKINFSRLTGKILGASIVGKNAGEMLPLLTSAMDNNISAYKLSKQVFAYPTKAELIKKVADSFVIYTLGNIKKELKYFIKSNILQILTAIIWLSIVLIYLYFKNKYELTNIDLAKKLYSFLTTSFWGPVLYIFIYAIRPIVFFPATFLTFMSGAVFGLWGGFLFTMIGENLSANLAYSLGRIFGKKLIPEGSNGFLGDIKKRVSKKTFIPILMTRLLFFPFDLVNYVAGILKVSWKGFFLGTLVGIIPGALVFIIAGASIQNAGSFDFSQIKFDLSFLLISLGLFLGSLALAKILKSKGY